MTNARALVSGGLLLVSYLALVRLLRYRNRNRIRVLAEKIRVARQVAQPRKNGDPLVSKDQEELLNLSAYDFGALQIIALELALFKTYSSPTISSLLHKTGEFRRNAEKRAEDTGLLLSEPRENLNNPERSNAAISRINEIHGRYRITNDDMMYTLALFMLEPARWIQKYGFRPLEWSEIETNFEYWKAMGSDMNIKDIPATYQEVERWTKEYEEKHVVYAETNRKVADSTTALLLKAYPTFLHPFLDQVVMAVLEPNVRRAFGYPDPSPIVANFVHSSLNFTGWLTRWFLLPRIMNPRRTSLTKDTKGLYRSLWSPFPSNMYGKGYKIEELGPAFGKGKSENVNEEK
ncbi:hypothetical protein BJ742DRAFT_781990 [Cladochytrium replicatum]|nr:hypothetical protein BJ742DRAFT_781990 [Cladochytrium replicatum]